MGSMVQIIMSILLYFVIFFGLAFILNMLLRRTWLMAFLYPFIIIINIDGISTIKYFTQPGQAFQTAYDKLMIITPMDITILLFGLAGAIVSGIVIKFLRKSGYQMF